MLLGPLGDMVAHYSEVLYPFGCSSLPFSAPTSVVIAQMSAELLFESSSQEDLSFSGA